MAGAGEVWLAGRTEWILKRLFDKKAAAVGSYRSYQSTQQLEVEHDLTMGGLNDRNDYTSKTSNY